MARLFEPQDANYDTYRKELLEQFPGSLFGSLQDLRAHLIETFKTALAEGSEEAIQKVLTANPYLIQYAIGRSGHHGIWVFPKPVIKPHSAAGLKGMIPDYLIVTRSSLGYFWHVVELKRFDTQFASKDGSHFSRDGQVAITQCNNYLTHFQDYIDTVRSNVQIAELIQPIGAIILIGDSATETKEQQTCRANFVRHAQKIDIVSYQRIIYALESDLRSGLGH